MSLKNRIVIITGATGKLGWVVAKKFAEQGARLVLVGTNAEKLAHLAHALDLSEARILLHVADVSDPGCVADLARATQEKFGQADILLHLVGGWCGGKSVSETAENEVKAMLHQHLWTTYYLAQAFVPLMTANHWGRILVISSPYAVQPAPNLAPYVIGKAAQEALMLTIAQEVKNSGVTANILLVKTIDTEHAREQQPNPKNASWTTPEEISATLLHLASDEAGTINGARIPLYGSP